MRRVQPEFHVTLIHRANSKQFPELWQKYSDLHANQVAKDPWSSETGFGDCQVMLERVSSIFFFSIILEVKTNRGRSYGMIVSWQS